MIEIGYHASHEQWRPRQLLTWTRRAEEAGFSAGMCSDHLQPWSPEQGQSAFAWSWLGAALESTSFSLGVVNAPGQRYHPVIIAQAAATLADMYPDRFWLAVGSGELLNERITGENWPSKQERNDRLRESVRIMRELWAGKTVTTRGPVTCEEARIWTRSVRPPAVIAAALSPATAEWAAGWADGLITASAPKEELLQVINGWKRGGGTDKPMFLQVKISYAESGDRALEEAWKNWKFGILDSPVLADLPSPEAIDAAAAFVRPEDMPAKVRISSRTDDHAQWLLEDIRLGFERLYIHNVNPGQEKFIADFGRKVIPALRGLPAGR